MRILILSQSLNPKTGSGVFTTSLAQGIKKAIPDAEITFLSGDDYLKPNFSTIIKHFFFLRSKAKEADLIHALDAYPYGVIAYLISIGLHKKLVITAVGSGSIGNLSNAGWRGVLLRLAYRRASRVTAISRYTAKEIEKAIPKINITVINHGVDYNFFSKPSDKTKDGLYIITQGEFKRRKGYTEILPVLKEVFDKHPELKYVIVAHTELNKEYQDELYALMDKLGIRNKIVITGSLDREKLREYYQNALLYLSLPKKVGNDVEGFGLAILEAAASGLPAVIGRGSGADDAVSEGESGLLVEGRNKTEVVAKVLSLVEDKNLRERMSKGAKERARRNAWENKIKEYVKMYEEI